MSLRSGRFAVMRAPLRLRRFAAAAAFQALGLSASGCELTEVTITEAEDVVVVEGLVIDDPAGSGEETLERAQVFLHRTLGHGGPAAVPGAAVRVLRVDRGDTLLLRDAGTAACVNSTPVGGEGTCHVVTGGEDLFRPGERLRLEVDLPDGGHIIGATAVPGTFHLLGAPAAGACYLAPDVPHELLWTRSQGAWAYLTSARIFGLPDALAARGISFDGERLDLTGLSVSAADTSIVVPTQLGVLERTELDHDVAVALQQGFPPDVEAQVTVAAVERNYVNWVRGGTFNPSGQVRIPSVAGDGTGFFGAAAVRSVVMATPPREIGDAEGCGFTTPGAASAFAPGGP